MGPFTKNDKVDDIEALSTEKRSANGNDSGEFIPDDGAVAAETFVIGDSFYARAQRLAGKFGVEQRGIERVPSDERTDAGMSQIGTLVWIPKIYLTSTPKSTTNSMTVAICQYGRFFVCNRGTRISRLLSWLHRYDLDYLFRKPFGYYSSLFLLDFRTSFRLETDGFE